MDWFNLKLESPASIPWPFSAILAAVASHVHASRVLSAVLAHSL